MDGNEACYWKGIPPPAPPPHPLPRRHSGDLKEYSFVCSDTLGPPLSSSVFGKHLMAAACVWPARAHLTQCQEVLGLGGLGGGVRRCCICYIYILCPYLSLRAAWKNMRSHANTRTHKVTTTLFSDGPPVRPYSVCRSVCILPKKGELCHGKGNVIGWSTVLYNTASWIKNWDIQHTRTRTHAHTR